MMKFGLLDTEIENIHKIFSQNQEIEKVIIFGSRAKGNYRNNSDIDLVIFGNINLRILNQINIELDNLRQQFEQNLTNYIEFSGFYVNLEDLDGLPERSILSAKTEKDGKTVYFVDENSGLFDDIMTFAKSTELRKKVYEVKRLSGRHPQFNNIDIISHIHLKKTKNC